MKKDICRVRRTCRVCGSNVLNPVIDLGDQYIASIFVSGDVPVNLKRGYPLEVVRCADPNGCGLVQLKHSFAPDVLYADYGYRSGTNEMMRANLRGIAAEAEALVTLKRGDVVLDIGCNDGTLLNEYKTPGIDRLGIDPAVNVTESAREKGFEVVNDFFSYASFNRVRPGRKAKIVTSIAMFYDLEAPQSFVNDISKLLDRDSLWVIELSYLPFMLEKKSFDTICHEHLEYYALRQVEWMLDKADLAVHGIAFNDINGGSFRLLIRKKEFGPAPEKMHALLEKTRKTEKAAGLDTDAPYLKFREAAFETKTNLTELLSELRSAGKTVYVYGASTKGNVTLQFCGIGKDLVTKAADRNPEKWGRHTLGTDIPIVSEDEARSDRPDYFLVLPWHFFDGFLKRESAFLERGGKFILPLPEVRMIGMDNLWVPAKSKAATGK